MKNEFNKSYLRLRQDQRLYETSLPIVAITGGIATGKSTVTSILRQKGLFVIDADHLVKKIYETEEAKKFIRDHIKEAWINSEINFKILRNIFFSDIKKKKLVEDFIYSKLPFSFQEEAVKITNQDFCIYDVPLLFEKEIDKKVDVSVLVYAPEEMQIERLTKRDGCSYEDAKKILSQQMSIEIKKNKANFIIYNDGSQEDLYQRASSVFNSIINTYPS
jgi:dephospho-CoA kinase